MRSPTLVPTLEVPPAANRALVLAPHPDDEIVGCGGLLRRLLDAGTEVEVCFLSDGSGGVEAVAQPAAYAARRRQEAEAVATQYGFSAVFLGARDGALAEERVTIAAGIAARLAARQPDLVLVPSPLENSADHRAAFAALRDAITACPVACTILAYEVNQPLRPHVVFDVSDTLPAIEAAMVLYSSQLERHPYTAAAVGLKRYRALTLGPTVVAAEGYAQLEARDLTTYSPERLVLELGAAPSLARVDAAPLVSVVVRTLDRPTLLAQALASLALQSWVRTEVVVVNDGGSSPVLPSDFPHPLRLVDLPTTHGRAAAANAGVGAATGDLITFLDDDDLADPEHLATLAGAASAAGVTIAYTNAAVGVYELDGGGWRLIERHVPYSRDFDRDLLLLDNYIPFNTIAIPRRCLAEVGPLDEQLAFFEDWELLVRLALRWRFHHVATVTCEYRHFRGGSHIFGESPRERADFLATKGRVIANNRSMLSPEVLAGVVDRLRAEAVMAQAEATKWRRDGERATSAATRFESELVGLRERHGELEESWRGLQREVARLQQVEVELRTGIGREADRSQQLHTEIERLLGSEAALYGETSRLRELIASMQATKAWQVHQRLQRWRGRG